MRTTMIAVCSVPGILILCVMAVVLIPGCSSPKTDSPPALVTLTTPATVLTTTSPTLTPGGTCRQGLTWCNGHCSDLTADVKNCGSCGNACPDGDICYQSKCLNMNIVCPPGQTECYDEKCYDLTSDNLNCGRCGNICPAYSGCTDSVCVAMDGEDILMFVVEYS